ncbi:MAG: hypothetical protein M1823_006021 [Watsoniomyces obsoletus]|nr:MAG: hypothetical protein M1823_006021 [Watsoniomyces obsoletus]
MDTTMSSNTIITTPSSEHSYPTPFDGGPWMPRTTAEWYAMRQLAPAQSFGAHPAAVARRPPSYHQPAQRSDRNSLSARRASPHRARVSKVGSSNVGMPTGLNMSPSTPLKRRTTTAGTTSTRTRSSMGPPAQHPQHLVHQIPSTRYPVPPSQAGLVWSSISDESPWANMASRPITWHAASNASSFNQPATSNLDPSSSYLAPQMDPWNLAGPAHTWAHRSHEPPTPSLYPASETTSPILPYSPSISNLGLNDLDLTQIYDPNALDLGAPAYDAWATTTTWLAGPKTDVMMLDPVSATTTTNMALTQPSRDAHSHQHHQPLHPSNLSYLATPSSPEMGSFLPIQRPEVDTQSQVPELPLSSSPSSSSSSEDEKELVGIGLYNDVTSRAAVMKGGHSGGLGSMGRATGKGLKLEETWVPPSTPKSSSSSSSRTEPPSSSSSVPTTRRSVAPVTSDGMVIAPNLLDATSMGLESSFLLDDGDLLVDAGRHYSMDGFYPAVDHSTNNHLFNYI